MEIVFFHKMRYSGGMSIENSFAPMIQALSKDNDVKEYNVPFRVTWPWNLIKNILYIRKHSTKTGINHISGDIHYGILGLLGRKSVLTIHDDYFMRTSTRGPLEKVYRWLFWIYLPIKFADVVICISPTTKSCIQHYYNSSKLQIITHHCFPLMCDGVQRPFNSNCPIILNVGTTPNKNLETTLKVLKGLHCKLVVLKPMTEEQKLMAKKFRIDFCNPVDISFEDVVKEYNKCDIVVFPSLYEGLGMPIAEAQSAGKPVITTNREPMSWVAGGAAVLLDDPLNIDEYRDKLMDLINNEAYRKSLIENGFENIKRFSLEEVVRQYTDIYKKLYKK